VYNYIIKMEDILKLLEKNILTNFDIIAICNYLDIKLDGVVMNNEFKFNWLSKPFSLVVNLENTDTKGTHWIGYYNNPSSNSIFYMDSFGEVCNAKIYNMIIRKGTNLYFNKKQFQDMDSEVCGWFVIYFLYIMNKSKNKLNGMVKYLKTFNYTHYEKNDKIVKQKMLQIIKRKYKI